MKNIYTQTFIIKDKKQDGFKPAHIVNEYCKQEFFINLTQFINISNAVIINISESNIFKDYKNFNNDIIHVLSGIKYTILYYIEDLEIKIKYKDSENPKLHNVQGDKSDWIDLYVYQDYQLRQGEFALIDLGVAMQLPKGYEANIVPRSSTFKNYGLLQTNSFAVIDESYNGDEDWWKLPVYATKNVKLNKGDRICQFRINKKMDKINFKEIQNLGNQNRGGFGSTGTR